MVKTKWQHAGERERNTKNNSSAAPKEAMKEKKTSDLSSQRANWV